MRIENGFLYIDTEYTPQTKKKITGHSFVDIAGLNPYSKRGDALLAYLKIYKPPFDKKYQYRGDMAEKMVGLILKRHNKNFLYYDEAAKKANNYDFFPNYKFCGGIPDFEIPSEKTTHEVKSKSLKDYDKIKNDIPKWELYQGLYYGYLRKHPRVIMDYVFFDEESEKLLFENKKPKTLDNCKILQKRYFVNESEIENMIIDVFYYIDSCLSKKAIPLEDISPSILKALNIQNDRGL